MLEKNNLILYLNYFYKANQNKMNTTFLTTFWKRNQPNFQMDIATWADELAFLYKSGISLEAALNYLHLHKPSIEEFEKWIQENALVISNGSEILVDTLTNEDLEFWNQNGYIVLKNAISKSDCEQTRTAIWNFLDKSPDDVASWYTQHPEQKGLMVNFSNHPTLNKNRMASKIKKAFEQLYQTDTIYKTIDKISFNPPVSDNYSFMGSGLHWDVSLKLPIPFRLQGLIYLSDCGANDGAFHCVPGFHNHIENWMKSLPKNSNPREVALQTLKPIPITGEAGDMVIWHQALPHCASPNQGKMPRMVQYLSYFPEEYTEAEEWI
jgi:hypothetical protein